MTFLASELSRIALPCKPVHRPINVSDRGSAHCISQKKKDTMLLSNIYVKYKSSRLHFENMSSGSGRRYTCTAVGYLDFDATTGAKGGTRGEGEGDTGRMEKFVRYYFKLL